MNAVKLHLVKNGISLKTLDQFKLMKYWFQAHIMYPVSTE